MDRWVEWFQHDIRKFTGKLWSHGREAMVRRCVLNIRGMLNRKEDVRGNAHRSGEFAGEFAGADGGANERTTISDVMLYTIEHLRAPQMWKLGAKMQDSKGEFDMGSFVTLDGKRSKLDTSFLGMVGKGVVRLTESFTEYYLPQPTHAAARPNETNDRFARAFALSQETLAKTKRNWAAQYGTNVDYFFSAAAKDGQRLCLTKAGALLHLRSLSLQFGAATWGSSLLGAGELNKLEQKSKARDVITELCRARTLARDVGKVPWAPEPTGTDPQAWAGAFAQQELARPLFALHRAE